ncbi:hypothetical protein [Chitinolyticbacter meiyuanensis]|uniref:hypothetical protein n=1 Tax=Chitinolyticbacter meiyuanensis TaxID=682798 RepID=UPI0011E5F996|nr:hypothetical protein [Chitinolyticbacter meiyuanensis]
MSRLQIILGAVGAAVILSLAGWVGYLLGADDTPVPENTAPAARQVQRDGSMVAERSPDPSPSPPPHVLPRGSQEERRVSVTVRPTKQPAPTVAPDGSVRCECPPVTVDLSLVQVDGGRRVVASSPDGQVISALDVPIDPAPLPPPERAWAVGVSYSTAQRWGVWAERDMSRVRVGLDLEQGGGGDVVARARLGWKF